MNKNGDEKRYEKRNPLKLDLLEALNFWVMALPSTTFHLVCSYKWAHVDNGRPADPNCGISAVQYNTYSLLRALESVYYGAELSTIPNSRHSEKNYRLMPTESSTSNFK